MSPPEASAPLRPSPIAPPPVGRALPLASFVIGVLLLSLLLSSLGAAAASPAPHAPSLPSLDEGAPWGTSARTAPSLAAAPPVPGVAAGTVAGFAFNTSAGVAPWGIAYASDNGLLYVAENGAAGANTPVLAISPTTGATLARVTAGGFSQGDAYDPANHFVYVANWATHNLTVVNTTTNTLQATLTTPGMQDVEYVTYDPVNQELYVPDCGSDSVWVINSTRDQVVDDIATSPTACPNGATVDPQDNEVFVPDSSGNDLLWAIDATTNTTLTSYTMPCSPSVPAFDPTTGDLYVPCETSAPTAGEVLTVDPANGKVLQTTKVPQQISQLLYDPSDHLVYSAGQSSNSVGIFDPATGTLLTTQADVPDANWMGYDPTNGEVYVSEETSGRLVALENVSWGLTQDLPVAGASSVGTPTTVPALNPSSGILYLPTVGTNAVIEWSTTTESVIATEGGLDEPTASVYDAQNGDVYVSNEFGDNITVYGPGAGTRPVANVGLVSGEDTNPEPVALALDAATQTLYIANYGGDNLFTVSTAGNVVGVTVPLTGCAPYSLALDSALGRLYVGCQGTPSGVVDVVALSNESLMGTLRATPCTSGPSWPVLVVDSATGDLFVGCGENSAVEVFSTLTNASVAVLGGFESGLGWGVASENGFFQGAYDPLRGEVLFSGLGGVYALNGATFNGSWVSAGSLPSASGASGLTWDASLGEWLALENLETTPSVGYLDPGPALTGFSTNTGVLGGDAGQAFALAPTEASDAIATSSTSYYGLPGCIAAGVTTSALGCTLGSPGSYLVRAALQDVDGMVGSVTETFTIAADPTVAITASATSVDAGSSIRFTAAPSGGWSGGSYRWTSIPSELACTASITASLNCTAETPATGLSVSASWTDAVGVVSPVASSPSFSIEEPPFGVSLPAASSPNPYGDDVGTTVWFNATSSGGVSPLVYAFTGLPAGCTPSGASAECTFIPGSEGTYWIDVTVTDANGLSATGPTLAYTVSPAPVLAALALAPASGTVALGSPLTVTAELSSVGSGGGSYAWTGLPAVLGCAADAGPVLACLPTAAVSGATVTVAYQDSNGVVTAALTSSPIAVVASPTVGPLTANRSALDVGQSVTLAAVVSGGSGTLTYTWEGLPGCPAASAASLSCAPTTAGIALVDLSVSDASGGNATAVPVVLDVSPELSSPTITWSSSSVTVGAPLAFSASVAGGAAPYSYDWSGLPTGCAPADQPTIVCTTTTAATVSVGVTVTDANGERESASSAATATVHAAASSSAPGPSSYDLLALLLALVAVVASLVALVAEVRRRGATPATPAKDERAPSPKASEADEGEEGKSPSKSPGADEDLKTIDEDPHKDLPTVGSGPN